MDIHSDSHDKQDEELNQFHNCKYVELNEIEKELSPQNYAFKAMHFNIRSLNENFHKLQLLLHNITESKVSLDFLLLCETFMTDYNCMLFNLPGYSKVEHHRKNSRGGGVAIYVKNCHDYKIRNDLSYYEEGIFESIFIETTLNKKQVLVGEIYRVPNSDIKNFNARYNSIIEKIKSEKKQLVIGSDQNLNLLHTDSQVLTQEFLDINYSNGILPVIDKPTRITHATATLIDNIYTNYEGIYQSGILYSHISDHLPVFLFFGKNFYQEKSNASIKITYRKITEASLNKIRQNLDIDWNSEMNDLNTEEAFVYLTDKINEVVNNNCPQKTLTISNKSIIKEPWMTGGLMNSSRKVEKLYKNCHNLSREHPSFKKYIKYRNLYNKTKRNAKTKFYHDRIIEARTDSAKTWKILNTLIGKTNNKNEVTSFFNINGTLTHDKNLISNGFCEFFSNVGPRLAAKIPDSNMLFTDFLKDPHPDSIFLAPTDPEEIYKILSNLRPKKSTGIDGISNDLLKKLSFYIKIPLSIAINKSLETGLVPDSLKIAKIIPIFKAKDKQLLTNYRPISLLPNISKILEKVVHKRIYTFLTSSNLLYKSQYGFRNNHSTNQAIAEFLSCVLKGFDDKKYTLALFLDLSKAFDTIDHNILLQKLNYYGIRGTAQQWIGSYLSGRVQYVEYNGVKSQLNRMTCGVPQGSVLGPLLFIIYMNDLHFALTHSSGILFADDTTIHYTNDNITDLFHVMNCDLNQITQWFRANKLSLNLSKTHYILFSSAYMEEPVHSHIIRINGHVIEPVNETVFLGLNIDKKLSWDAHTKTISSKLSSSLYLLRQVSNCIPKEVLKTLYFSLVYSKLQYGIMHWGNKGTFAYNLEPIIRKQEKAICIINKKKYTKRNSHLFSAVKSLKFQDIVYLEMMKFMYDNHHNNLPQPLLNLFTRNANIHNYNTRHARDPHLGIYIHKQVSESFLHKAPFDWAKLDVDITSSLTKESFTKKLKKKIIANYD